MSVCWCGIVVRSQELPCPLCHESRKSQSVGEVSQSRASLRLGSSRGHLCNRDVGAAVLLGAVAQKQLGQGEGSRMARPHQCPQGPGARMGLHGGSE